MNAVAGQVIRGYEILDKIGEGGQGAVFRARHAILKREVALKVIRPDLADDAETIQRFKQEVAIVLKLNHPNIVPIYDYWHDDEGIYIAMHYMSGGSLRAALAQGTWSPEDLANMLDRLADALASAHSSDIIHRDLKPDNILLDASRCAYLTDFGIAKRLNADRITLSYIQLGSPAYLSPEQILNRGVSPQTDIYMLGITLYEAIVGEHPFPEDTSMQLMLKQVREPLPFLHVKARQIPYNQALALDVVIQRATTKDPDERYPDVIEFAEAFRAAVEGGM